MKKTRLATTVLSLALASGLMLFGCSTGSDGESTGEQNSQEAVGDVAAEPAAEYAIAEESLVDGGYGSYTVAGTFTNTSGKEMTYVQVSYRMMDASGAQIGTAFANTNNLPDGSSWKFEAVYFDTSAAPASFELADVSYW